MDTKNIYIKLDEVPETIKSLIESIFLGIDLKPHMLHYNSWVYAKPTYKDKACTTFECRAGRRSFEDLYCLTTTYFPNATKVELIKALMSIDRLRWYVCRDIRKVVFHGAASYRSQPLRLDSLLCLDFELLGLVSNNINTTQVTELIDLVKKAEK